MSSTPKFIIALQFHEADKATALRLAKLIADIEPAPRLDVEFVMVARFDTEHDPATLEYVSKKFPTTTWITSHTKWRGWPGGPNGMALDTIEWMHSNRREALGLMLIEPDCVPTSPFWLGQIIDEWEGVLARGQWLMGAWRDSGGADGHINGNCVMLADFETRVPVRLIVGPDLAWDCAIAPYVKNHWAETGSIKNCFQSRNATLDHLFDPVYEGGDSPALVHGFKDDSAFELAKSVCVAPDIEL